MKFFSSTKGKKQTATQSVRGSLIDGPEDVLSPDQLQELIKDMNPDKIVKILKKFAEEDGNDLVGKECIKAMKRAVRAKKLDGEKSLATTKPRSPKHSPNLNLRSRRKTLEGKQPTTTVSGESVPALPCHAESAHFEKSFIDAV